MSSVHVRTLITDFLAANAPDETVIDLSTQYTEMRDMIEAAGLNLDDPWLGLSFIGDDELPVSLAATNDKGLYREVGTILLHVCAEAKLGVQNSMLARGEALRNLFRGCRIGSIVVEGVGPMNFGLGATLDFDGGYVSCTISISYHSDLNL